MKLKFQCFLIVLVWSMALTAVTAAYIEPHVLNPISQASTAGGIAAYAAWGGIQAEITGGDFVSGGGL